MNTHLHRRSAAHRPPVMSPDGYIRLPLASLDTLSFVHLFSQNDEDFLHELRGQTIPVSMAGFSEWKSSTEPAISLGWGWFVHGESERMLLAPEGVRSNVMLIDAYGYDLGAAKTSHLLHVWLDLVDWQTEVCSALDLRPTVNFASYQRVRPQL